MQPFHRVEQRVRDNFHPAALHQRLQPRVHVLQSVGVLRADKEANRHGLRFFFKQKTAYEIQGDWSSDVCSSDLSSTKHGSQTWLARPTGLPPSTTIKR